MSTIVRIAVVELTSPEGHTHIVPVDYDVERHRAIIPLTDDIPLPRIIDVRRTYLPAAEDTFMTLEKVLPPNWRIRLRESFRVDEVPPEAVA